MSVACASEGFYGLGEETPVVIISFVLGYLVLRLAKGWSHHPRHLQPGQSNRYLAATATLPSLPNADSLAHIKETYDESSEVEEYSDDLEFEKLQANVAAKRVFLGLQAAEF